MKKPRLVLRKGLHKILTAVLCTVVLLSGCAKKSPESSSRETSTEERAPSIQQTETTEEVQSAIPEAEGERAAGEKEESPQVHDPHLQIFTPESPAGFNSRIVVMGRITDSVQPSSSADGISSLRYRIIEIPSMTGEIAFDREDGTFLLDMNAEAISGLKTLRITATALSGRVVSRDLLFVDTRPRPSLSTVGVPHSATATQSPSKKAVSLSRDISVSSGRITTTTIGKDTEMPFLKILSPEPMSSWTSMVVIKGQVGNSTADIASASEIRLLSYSIPTRSPISNEIAFERDSGNFSVELDSASFTGMQEVQIAAENLRGGIATATLPLLFGGKQPYVSITAPENGSFYRSQLTVIGRVSNSEDDIESASQVRSLSYRLVSQQAQKEIDFSSKTGVFTFDLDVEGLSGKQAVLIRAEDEEGNVSTTSLNLLDGKVKPILTITSPPDQSEYGAGVFVIGSLNLSTEGEPLREAIKSLSYRIAPAETFDLQSSQKDETIEFDNDGSFRFLLSTENLSGSQLISVSAEVWNGNKTTSKVTIVEGTSDIPSFTVTSGNEKAVLEWDPVPRIERYDLYYSKDASPFPESNGQIIERIDSPAVLSNLENGVMYSFKLHAKGPPGSEGFWSASKHIIPLSPTTLAPVVTGEYGQIRLTWTDIPGAEAYTVLRSSDGGQSYSELEKSLSEASFVDVTTVFGKTYYYKIRPSITGAIESDARSGRTIAFPTTRLMHVASNTEPKAKGVAIRSDYAYLACGGEGLKIVDIYDPKALNVVGTLETGDARRLRVRGDYAYLADGEKGFKIIDVSDPLDPQEIGARKTSNANDIVIQGDYSFIADSEMGVKVIDISNPRFPGRIGSVQTTNAQALEVKADYIFVADGKGGLKVIDISRPRKPTVISEFATLNASGITIQGDRAYVADRNEGVKVLDISNPASPVMLWSYDAEDARNVKVWGDYLFIADGVAGVKAIDISDPLRPLPFGTFATTEARDLGLSGPLIYVADSSQFMALQAVVFGRSHQIATCETDGIASRVFSSGGYAYIADHEKGLKIVDVSDPYSVNISSITGAIDTQFAMDVVTSGEHAFVADGIRGVKVIDTSGGRDANSETQPVLVASFTTEGKARAIDISGDQLVVVSEGEGFELLSVADPRRPVLLGYQNTSDARDACIIEINSGRKFICVADGEKGLKVFDISDPAHPHQAGKVDSLNARIVTPYKTPQGIQHLCVISPSALTIIDLTDPFKPRPIGSFATEFAEDAIVCNRYIFLADGYRGLKIIDISNPSLPTLVSICEDVYAVGIAPWQEGECDYALLVDSTGLKVIQILVPEWLKTP